MKLRCMIATVVFIGAECDAVLTHSWVPFLLVAVPTAGTVLALSIFDRLNYTRNWRVDRLTGDLGRDVMGRVMRWFGRRPVKA
jgi:hypothetical protein